MLFDKVYFFPLYFERSLPVFFFEGFGGGGDQTKFFFFSQSETVHFKAFKTISILLFFVVIAKALK